MARGMMKIRYKKIDKRYRMLDSRFSILDSRSWCYRASDIEYRVSKRKGQSVTEYAMFITVVVMALLAMQVYLKRGVQGKIRDMADQISPVLYNPSTSASNYSTNTSSETRANFAGGVFRSDLVYESTNRTGVEYAYPEVTY